MHQGRSKRHLMATAPLFSPRHRQPVCAFLAQAASHGSVHAFVLVSARPHRARAVAGPILIPHTRRARPTRRHGVEHANPIPHGLLQHHDLRTYHAQGQQIPVPARNACVTRRVLFTAAHTPPTSTSSHLCPPASQRRTRCAVRPVHDVPCALPCVPASTYPFVRVRRIDETSNSRLWLQFHTACPPWRRFRNSASRRWCTRETGDGSGGLIACGRSWTWGWKEGRWERGRARGRGVTHPHGHQRASTPIQHARFVAGRAFGAPLFPLLPPCGASTPFIGGENRRAARTTTAHPRILAGAESSRSPDTSSLLVLILDGAVWSFSPCLSSHLTKGDVGARESLDPSLSSGGRTHTTRRRACYPRPDAWRIVLCDWRLFCRGSAKDTARTLRPRLHKNENAVLKRGPCAGAYTLGFPCALVLGSSDAFSTDDFHPALRTRLGVARILVGLFPVGGRLRTRGE
ncbi:hypothetical protein B0H19DRAFT_80274 [Mycena capillaripes]|nr:hypothetical protein B0H19DRAFT_80274 [Mycena capillaripes]